MAALLEHKNLTLDELIHYGTLGQVQWLDADIAKRLEEYRQEEIDTLMEDRKEQDDYITEIDNLESDLNSCEHEKESMRHVINVLRDEFEKYPQLKNNMPTVATAMEEFD